MWLLRQPASQVPHPPKQPTLHLTLLHSPHIFYKPHFHTIVLLDILIRFACSSLLDCVVCTSSHHPHRHHSHLSQASTPFQHSMQKRLVIVVLFTLYLQPVAAANPAMSFASSVPPMDRLFIDIDDPPRCFECALFYWECMCALVSSN